MISLNSSLKGLFFFFFFFKEVSYSKWWTIGCGLRHRYTSKQRVILFKYILLCAQREIQSIKLVNFQNKKSNCALCLTSLGLIIQSDRKILISLGTSETKKKKKKKQEAISKKYTSLITVLLDF